METSQVIQEIVAYSNTNSWKNNKEKKLKSWKKEGGLFIFLVYFFFNLKKKGGYFRLFSEKHPP